MLAPKRVKFRKWQKGRLRGPALRGATIANLSSYSSLNICLSIVPDSLIVCAAIT